jgi:hypothetical protein
MGHMFKPTLNILAALEIKVKRIFKSFLYQRCKSYISILFSVILGSILPVIMTGNYVNYRQDTKKGIANKSGDYTYSIRYYHYGSSPICKMHIQQAF